jgi:hypothetical protein
LFPHLDGAGAPTPARGPPSTLTDIALFFGLYLLMIGMLATWARLLAARLPASDSSARCATSTA